MSANHNDDERTESTDGTGGQAPTGGQATDGGQPSTGGQTASQRPDHQQSSGSDLDANVAGALCYALTWISGLFFFFTEKEDDFIRFHAAQSIVAFGALSVVYVIITQVLWSMLWSAGGFGMLQLISLLNTLLMLVGLGLWLGMMYVAYEGRRYELPVFGDIANNLISDDDVTVERRN